MVGEFGDVCALLGENDFSGGTIHRQNGLSQLTAGLDRLPNLRVDVFEGAEGGTERRGVVVGVQHLNRATAR